jgi:predicted transcriptional regulator
LSTSLSISRRARRSEIHVYHYDAAADPMSREERAALERALDRSLAQADAGDLIEADDVVAELQRR